MDWALVTWGLLIGMVGLLWVMVVASVQDEQTPASDSEGAPHQTESEGPQPQEQYERHAAA